MFYIKQKIQAGVLNLKQVPTYKLLEWAKDAPQDDKDLIMCEVFYR